MKTFVVTVVIIAAIIARLNLPENNVKVALGHEPGIEASATRAMAKLYLLGAKWKVHDFGLFKTATTSRLNGCTVVALPFADEWYLLQSGQASNK